MQDLQQEFQEARHHGQASEYSQEGVSQGCLFHPERDTGQEKIRK